MTASDETTSDAWAGKGGRAVAGRLLGSWPTEVAKWGREGISAFLAELRARGLTPEQAIIGICSKTGAFPPSVPEIVQAAHRDPSRPTWEEAYRMIWGSRGVLRARPAETTWPDGPARDRAYRKAALDLAATMHPAVHAFVSMQGPDNLRMIEVDDPDWGHARREELRQAYERLCASRDDRELAAIARGGRRDGLHAFDPLAALGIGQTRELEAGQ